MPSAHTVWVRIKVPPNEKKQIQQFAASVGMSVTRWIRCKLLGTESVRQMPGVKQ